MDAEIKKFIKKTLSFIPKTKEDICDSMGNWGWFDVQETWDQAIQEGLIKKLDEHYWIWHETKSTKLESKLNKLDKLLTAKFHQLSAGGKFKPRKDQGPPDDKGQYWLTNKVTGQKYPVTEGQDMDEAKRNAGIKLHKPDTEDTKKDTKPKQQSQPSGSPDKGPENEHSGKDDDKDDKKKSKMTPERAKNFFKNDFHKKGVKKAIEELFGYDPYTETKFSSSDEYELAVESAIANNYNDYTEHDKLIVELHKKYDIEYKLHDRQMFADAYNDYINENAKSNPIIYRYTSIDEIVSIINEGQFLGGSSSADKDMKSFTFDVNHPYRYNTSSIAIPYNDLPNPNPLKAVPFPRRTKNVKDGIYIENISGLRQEEIRVKEKQKVPRGTVLKTRSYYKDEITDKMIKIAEDKGYKIVFEE